jgi:hypothetical protein
MAFITGGVFAVLALPLLAAPEPCRRGLPSFSRSVKAAWLLTGIDLVWVAWIVLNATFGKYEYLKPAVYVAAPVCFYVLVVYLDELLAPRSLGGLLLLAANPILYSERWHESPWRLVMPVIAYALVVAGMILVLSPYRFRDWTSVLASTPARCRLCGLFGLVLGGAVVALGYFVY